MVFFFYDGETPPLGVFDKFNAIPILIDNAKVQSYSDLVRGPLSWNGASGALIRLSA